MITCLSCGHKLTKEEEWDCLGVCPSCGKDNLQVK